MSLLTTMSLLADHDSRQKYNFNWFVIPHLMKNCCGNLFALFYNIVCCWRNKSDEDVPEIEACQRKTAWILPFLCSALIVFVLNVFGGFLLLLPSSSPR